MSERDPVAELIASATGVTGEVNPEAAIDAVTAVRDVEAETGESLATAEPTPEPEVFTAPVQGESKRKTKAELQQENERLSATVQSQGERLKRLEAITSGKAVNDLGATIALAIDISGRFMAARRGPHWKFPQSEAKELGEAWALVAAPYAEQLKEAVPWVLAIGLTWKSVSVRLEQDGALAPAESAESGESGEA